MGLIDRIKGIFKQVSQEDHPLETSHLDDEERWDLLFKSILDISSRHEMLNDIFSKDWSSESIENKDKIAKQIRRFMNRTLIPAAGMLSLSGIPGILVYTPCQLVGAMAVAHVYAPELTLSLNSARTILSIIAWGKAGQFTWIQLVGLMPFPVINITVIPFVMGWTWIALSKVQNHYRDQEIKRNSTDKPETFQVIDPDPADNSSPDGEDFSTSGTQVGQGVNIGDSPDPLQASPDFSPAYDLLTRIQNGGKVLYPAQAEVFRNLVENQGELSALTLGKTHSFRGVAGSGKTVILTQLIPYLFSRFQKNYGKEPSVLVFHHNSYMRQLLRKEVNAAMKHPMKLPPFPDSFSKQKIHIHTLTTLINFLDNKNLFRNKPKSTIDRTQTAKAVRQALKCVAGEFDIILVDEGQDLDEAQYDLLLHLCKADKLTGGKSVFIFYDDLQNIFGMEGSVTSRLSAETIEHFLPQCVRTSKKIMDFVFNTCISSSIQLEDRHRIEEYLRLPFLKDQGYISEMKLPESQIWIDCNFCVFPGEIEPQIERFLSRANCFESLQKELITLFSDQDLRDKLKDGILIICFKNDFAEALYKHLSSSLGEDVQLRSGSSIKAREKLSALAVEPACVNIVNIWDAKGYDADIVYILNPDDGGGSSYEHRMRFYVSATRAKQFLGVYTTKPPEDTPIFNDAAKAIEVLNDWPKLVETSPRP